jgi:hypothetical protein
VLDVLDTLAVPDVLPAVLLLFDPQPESIIIMNAIVRQETTTFFLASNFNCFPSD